MTGLRVVLARHGQTPANVARVLDTRLPGPGLTDRGRRQAAALGTALAAAHPPPDGIVGVYSSAAARARETAVLVGAALGPDPAAPTVVEGLQEVQVGDLEGRNDEAAVAVFRDTAERWRDGELDLAFAAGESARDLLERFGRGLDEVRRRHPAGGTAVVVAHGAAIRLATRALAADPTGVAPDHLDNCGYVVLADTGEGWRIERWEPSAPDGERSAADATSG